MFNAYWIKFTNNFAGPYPNCTVEQYLKAVCIHLLYILEHDTEVPIACHIFNVSHEGNHVMQTITIYTHANFPMLMQKFELKNKYSILINDTKRFSQNYIKYYKMSLVRSSNLIITPLYLLSSSSKNFTTCIPICVVTDIPRETLSKAK
jgi:hypothetical protein